jgi:hypothetical protein
MVKQKHEQDTTTHAETTARALFLRKEKEHTHD